MFVPLSGRSLLIIGGIALGAAALYDHFKDRLPFGGDGLSRGAA